MFAQERQDSMIQEAGLNLMGQYTIDSLPESNTIVASGQENLVPVFPCPTLQGFLKLRWSRFARVVFTRSFAIVPTVFVAAYRNVGDLTGLNDFLNALQSILVRLPTIPFPPTPIISRDSRTDDQLRSPFASFNM